MIVPRVPAFSPERTMLTYMAGKTCGCIPIAPARDPPSITRPRISERIL